MSRSHNAKAVCGGDAPSPSGECDAFVAIPKPTSGEAPLARSATRSSQLHIASRQRARKINRRLLKQITTALLADLKIEKADLGIHLVAAPEMTRLNETFLRHQGSTDVIAFDYANEVAPVSRLPRPSNRRHSSSRDGCATLHGEIFVCVEEAIRQARKFGTSWQSEIARYVVHGILHLLGHDDRRAADRRKMKSEEDRRLRELSGRFPLSKLGHGPRLAAWNRKVCSRAGAPVF